MDYTIATHLAPSLSPDLKKNCRLLVPPRFRCCLDGIDPDEIEGTEIVVFTVISKQDVVAIALLGLYNNFPFGELFCLKIKDDSLDSRLCFDLLQQVEEIAFVQDKILINHFLRLNEPESPLLSTILKERGWDEPKLFLKRFFFDSYTFEPPWYETPPVLPSQIKEFLWKNLKPGERKVLQNEYAQGHFSDQISPFFKEDKIEPVTSLGLRYKKQVIGWAINHLVAPDTLRYTSLYIKPEFKHTGYAIRLLVDSIKRQQNSPYKWSLFELNTQSNERSWATFVTRRLAPYALSVDDIYQTWKASSPGVFKLPSSF